MAYQPGLIDEWCLHAAGRWRYGSQRAQLFNVCGDELRVPVPFE